MFKLTKCIATAAVVLVPALAPSAAYARLDLNPPATAPAANSQPAHTAAAPSAAKASAYPSHGFRWDDAGIGAAGVLMLVSAGSGAMVMRRRRRHHPLTS